MPETSMHIRHYMLSQFQLGNNVSAAARHIYATPDEDGVADRLCRDLFKRFREGDTSLEGCPWSGCPLQSDIERIKILIEDNPPLTTRELSAMLGRNQSAIDCHLHHIGKVNKLGRWLPHQLTSNNSQQRITICNFLLSKHHRYGFLQHLVTDDERWVLCVEHRTKYK